MLPPLGTESQLVIPVVRDETLSRPRDKSYVRKTRQSMTSGKRFDLWAARLFAFALRHEWPIQDAFASRQRQNPPKTKTSQRLSAVDQVWVCIP